MDRLSRHESLPQITGANNYIISMAKMHCPPGYVLQKSSYTSSDFGLSCVCDTDYNIVNCEPDYESVLLKVCHLVVCHLVVS